MSNDIFKPNSTKIVLGHPFSGALYAYFDQEINQGGHAKSAQYHGYYKTLYGNHFKANMDVAIALSLMYDNILLVGADNPLPDQQKYYGNEGYHNPDLGLYTSWNINENNGRIPGVMMQSALKDRELQTAFQDIPKQAWTQIIDEVYNELLMSAKFGASLYTSGTRQAIAKRLTQITGSTEIQMPLTEKPKLVANYLDITGLLFQPMNIDAFYYLKTDKELRQYASSFTHLIETYSPESTKDIRIEMLLLIQEAMAKDKLNSKIGGIFKGASTVSSYVGLVPFAGLPVGMAGIGSDWAARGVEKVNHKNKWYEFAGQIERIKILERIHAQLKDIG